ncbi:MAG: amidohydrolase family protein [Candidatus Doudnabacteria bacterium]|nr:amidohydrolase family protein [Candidatus Doudnabacteria bacterium]
MFDLIIKNGLLVDGTGAKPKKADLAVKNSGIAEIGHLKTVMGKRVIDASGLIVCPGFVDVQNHSDSFWTLFDYPHQESMLLQGITTIVVGQCGASLAPLPSLDALKAVQKWHSLDGTNVNWHYFEEFLSELGKQPLGVNVASLVGHSTIRRGLLKDAVRKVTAQEFKVFNRLFISSLKSGAFGMSLGLVYAHEMDAAYEELMLLAKTAVHFNRFLAVHLRNEENQILEALDEVIKLALDTGVRIKISHLKLRGSGNWPLFEQALNRLENAVSAGAKIAFDVYPYDTSWSVLYTYLPKWSYEGGRTALSRRLNQPYIRKKIENSLLEKNQNLPSVVVATASALPHLVGRSLGDIAASQNSTVEKTLLDILISCDSEVVVFEENINREQLGKLMVHPLAVIASDGAGFDLAARGNFRNLVHPRCFGTMPRFLSLVLRSGVISLEEAIFRISGKPAQFLRLVDRGVIKRGAKADLVVFDPEKIIDLATLENPFQTSRGIKLVTVGGTISVLDEKLTGSYSGSPLKANN